MREGPELRALAAPVLLFIATGSLEVPPRTALLIPVWLIVVDIEAGGLAAFVAWSRRGASSLRP